MPFFGNLGFVCFCVCGCEFVILVGGVLENCRFESSLKNACKRFVMEQKPTFITDDNPNKDINVAFYNLPMLKR